MIAWRPDVLVAIVIAERDTIRRAVVYAGVGDSDVDDVVQTVTITAWETIRDGRLVIAAERDARAVMRSWLRTVAWRTAKAWPHEQHEELSDDAHAIDPMPQIEARAELRRLRRSTTREELRMLAAFADGATIAEYAAARGVPFGTAASFVWRTRARLRRL